MVETTEEMKWGITGGSGQLACALVELLNSHDIPNVAWSRSQLDITDTASMSIIEEIEPTILVNCAAWTNVDGAEDSFEEALRVNRDGVQNVAMKAKELEIPLIHISTDYVFSGATSKPWKVDHATEPTSGYGLSKLMGEQVIKKIWPEKSAIFRTAWLFGPHGKNFAKTIIRKALTTRDEIKVVNDQTGQPTTTVDLALQILNFVNISGPPGTYHATNSGSATWWDFACELVELSGEDKNRVKPVSSEELPSTTRRPSYSVLDHSGWSKVNLQEMRDWRVALHEIFPRIREAIEKDL
jgi:dTDP-4-dehydrorhamnose reductase